MKISKEQLIEKLIPQVVDSFTLNDLIEQVSFRLEQDYQCDFEMLVEDALTFGLIDDLIDRDLTLCVDQDYLSKAVQMLKNRGMMDSSRLRNYGRVQQGLCDQSVRLKQVIKTITGVED